MINPLHSTPPEFSLSGQLLVAMPSMLDPSFSGSVIYLCEHSSKGAMGLIVNRPTDLSVRELLGKVDLKVTSSFYEGFPVMFGGPVAGERGFVLHTGERVWGSSLLIAPDIHLTTSKDILEALAQGQAPENCLVTLGYAGWGEGQLEEELAQNAWLNVPAHLDVLFKLPLAERFASAYGLLGIDPMHVSSFVGHA
jgi:putative transcriptional regulator